MAYVSEISKKEVTIGLTVNEILTQLQLSNSNRFQSINCVLDKTSGIYNVEFSLHYDDKVLAPLFDKYIDNLPNIDKINGIDQNVILKVFTYIMDFLVEVIKYNLSFTNIYETLRISINYFHSTAYGEFKYNKILSL